MKNFVIVLIGISLFAAGLAGAGVLTPDINQQRRDLNLTVSDEVYELPADMAVAQAALGTFRGVAINFLWQRAENLKNEGKYHEAIQLGELITKLQPRFPQVWTFVSWNQAYNISVGTNTPEERWNWVKSGIDLLQNKGKGIDANPNSLPLYWQLGWIYFHKVGQFQDNQNWYYKEQLADTWHTILGQPPLDEEEYDAWLRQVVEAPAKFENLPEGARRLGRWLQEEEELGFDLETLSLYTVPSVVTETTSGDATPPATPEAGAEAEQQPQVTLQPRRLWPEEINGQPVEQADIEALVNFIRRQVLTGEEINMDPSFMLALTEQFGPIDWRSPFAHTLYWAEAGLQRVSEDEGRSTDNYVATKRNALNALQAMARQGQVLYQPPTDRTDSYISYLPMWPMWLAYDEYFLDVVEELDTQGVGDAEERVERLFGSGYRNQMDAAISDAFLYGGRETAEELYNRLGERYDTGPISERYDKPLSEFIDEHLLETLENPDQARSAVVAMLTQSLTDRVLYNKPQEAEEIFNRAQNVYAQYRQINDNPNDPLYKEMPPFEQLNVDAIAAFVAGNGGPVGLQNVPIGLRSNIYLSLPLQAQQYVYTAYGNVLMQQAMAAGYDPQSLFPQPGTAARERDITRDQVFQTLDAEKGDEVERTEVEEK